MAEMEDSGLTRSTVEGFNVNDFPVTEANGEPSEAYTAENWRNHEGIYVNDGGNKEITVNGKTLKGFKNVSLPNSKQASASAHIPSDVWGEVWAAGSDWELAFNLCGITNIDNSNFLGFYNKYTGILRIFTYIDNCVKTDANNHMWVMQMHDALSSHAVFRYGLPMDRKINKKEIGLVGFRPRPLRLSQPRRAEQDQRFLRHRPVPAQPLTQVQPRAVCQAAKHTEG